MKKKFLLLIGCLLTMSWGIYAQELLIDNFENGTKTWYDIGLGADAVFVSPNPDASGPVNTSSKVLQINYPEGDHSGKGPIRWGAAAPLGTGSGEYLYAHVKMYYPYTATCCFKLEAGPDGHSFECWSDITVANQWVDVVFDLPRETNYRSGTYNTIFIMAKKANVVPSAGSIYIDDIRFSNTKTPYTSLSGPSVADNAASVFVTDNKAFLTFKSEESSGARMLVYNAAGQLVEQTSFVAVSGSNTLTLGVEKPGMYIVKIEAAGKTMACKFVK